MYVLIKNILRFVETFLAYLNAQYVGVKTSLFGYFKHTCLHLPVPVHQTAYPPTTSTKLHKKKQKKKPERSTFLCSQLFTNLSGYWASCWNPLYNHRGVTTSLLAELAGSVSEILFVRRRFIPFDFFCLGPGFQTVNWVMVLHLSWGKKTLFSPNKDMTVRLSALWWNFSHIYLWNQRLHSPLSVP